MTGFRQHAIIAGSLGKQNVGDEALLQAFLRRHEIDYAAVTVLTRSAPRWPKAPGHWLKPPLWAIGPRFWRGLAERRRVRRAIVQQAPDAARDFVWLGGLLSANPYHLRARLQELAWARRFCARLIYYFGDAVDDFPVVPDAHRMVGLINQTDAWIAVRSTEAAALLDQAGLKTKVHVGLDAVLYERVVQRGLPFPRQQPATESLAIIPCRVQSEQMAPVWIAAARAAVRLGLAVRWLSLCDPEDLPVCQDLADLLRTEAPHHPQQIASGPQVEEALSDAACCVATRYHGAIFALSNGLPTVAVPYRPKVERLFRSLDLEAWIAFPPASGEPRDAEPVLLEQIRAGLAGEFALNGDRLREGARKHREALLDLGASHPDLVPDAASAPSV